MKNEELNIKNLTQNNNLRCNNHLCAKLTSKLQYLTTKKQQTKVCCSLKFGKSAELERQSRSEDSIYLSEAISPPHRRGI